MSDVKIRRYLRQHVSSWSAVGSQSIIDGLEVLYRVFRNLEVVQRRERTGVV